MVDAAATIGTGSVALKRKLRAAFFTCSTMSSGPKSRPPIPPKDFESVETTMGTRPWRPSASRLPRPSGAERPGGVRVVEDERRVVAVAELDELAQRRLVAVERVHALAEDERVLALARLEDALEALGRVVVEEANLGAVLGHTGREERAVENARVAVRVEDERRVLVGESGDRAEHRLVARSERQTLLEPHPLREAVLELDVHGRRGLRSRRGQAARVLVDRALRRLLDLGVGGQPQVVVRAEVDDLLAADVGVQPAAAAELAEERIVLIALRLANAHQRLARLRVNPALRVLRRVLQDAFLLTRSRAHDERRRVAVVADGGDQRDASGGANGPRTQWRWRWLAPRAGALEAKAPRVGAAWRWAIAASIPIAPPAPSVSPSTSFGATTEASLPSTRSIASSSASSKTRSPDTPETTRSTSRGATPASPRALAIACSRAIGGRVHERALALGRRERRAVAHDLREHARRAGRRGSRRARARRSRRPRRGRARPRRSSRRRVGAGAGGRRERAPRSSPRRRRRAAHRRGPGRGARRRRPPRRARRSCRRSRSRWRRGGLPRCSRTRPRCSTR